MTNAAVNSRFWRSALALAPILTAALLYGAAPIMRGAATSPLSEPSEQTARLVVLANGETLFVQKYEVTISEWNACHAAGGCVLKLRAPKGLSPEKTPATGINRFDAQEYVAWISERVGRPFRLPTLAEWSEIASAVVQQEAAPLFTDPALAWASTYVTGREAPRALRPSGGYSTSPSDIADLDGSVWEWTQDCYAGVRDSDGVEDPASCPAFYAAGEHVAALSVLVRDPARGGCAVGSPPAHLGMRLVSHEPF